MWSITALSPLSGVFFGYLIAYFVDDETYWYQKYFRLTAIILFFVASLLYKAPLLTGFSIFIGLVAFTMFVIGLITNKAWLLALPTIIISSSNSIGSLEFLLVAMIFSAGALYSTGIRKGFLWFLSLIPFVVFL